MRIGIDVSQVIYGTGVSSYTKNLVNSLLGQDNANQYILFGSSFGKFDQFSRLIHPKSNAIFKSYPFPANLLDLLWNRWHILPVENLIGQVDVFHSSDWTQPPTKRAGKITTIHDLSPLIVPELIPKSVVETHKKRLEWVKKEVDLVIAVSDTTKHDIMKYLSIPAEKIRVIYEAADGVFAPMGRDQVEQVEKKYNLPNKYFLFVGTGRRKNLEMAQKVVEEKFRDYKLVVVGSSIGKNLPSTVFLGNVPAVDLAALYTGARALIYISLYEGFGLPVLEAMASGCPVVVSNIAALVETSGKAAVLVDPYNENSLIQGINQAIDQKEELAKKGLERARQFSWQTSAQQTLQMYQDLTVHLQ